MADEGLKIDPNNWDLYDLKSNACLFQSDFKCAIDALAQAYAVDSTRADSSFYKKIAVAAAQQPDTARLLEWSQRGLKKYPDNVELLGYAEQAYMLTGQTDSVVAIAKRLLAADPTQIDPALAAIQSLATAGRIAEAHAAHRDGAGEGLAAAEGAALGHPGQRGAPAAAEGRLSRRPPTSRASA